MFGIMFPQLLTRASIKTAPGIAYQLCDSEHSKMSRHIRSHVTISHVWDTMQDTSPALVYAVRHVKSSSHALFRRSFINEKVIRLSSSFRVGIRYILQGHTLLESE